MRTGKSLAQRQIFPYTATPEFLPDSYVTAPESPLSGAKVKRQWFAEKRINHLQNGIDSTTRIFMKLKNNSELLVHIWDNHKKNLMEQFSPEIKETYQFIFALHDWKSLFLIEQDAIRETIELCNVCFVESSIKMALEESLKPAVYNTHLPARDHIEVTSFYHLGMIHKITENLHGGFLIEKFFRSAPNQILESYPCKNLDKVINTLIAYETEHRETRFKTILSEEKK